MTKSQPFGHEKPIVYQKAMRFADLRCALLDRLSWGIAACEHLDRAAERVLMQCGLANEARQVDHRDSSSNP